MKHLLFVFVFMTMIYVNLGESSSRYPTAKLLKTAYCACMCCKKENEECYKHPSIEKDYICDPDGCSEQFCAQWQKAKCNTGCYCKKCKHLLSPGNPKCALHTELHPDCKCGDLDKIDCDIEEAVEDDDHPQSGADHQSECVKQCYCKKCKQEVPEGLKDTCKKAGPPKKGCSCSDTKCPGKTEMERVMALVAENKPYSEKVKDIRKEIDSSDEEVNLINKKLKSQIDSGKTKPVTKDSLKATKCNLQCLCDACGWDNPMIETNCKKMIKKREKNCPACPKEIDCPEVDEEINCKMYCFCSKCKKDKRMPQNIKDKCKEFVTSSKLACPCTEKVDCDTLGKLGGSNNKDSPKTTSEDGKSRPGKFKKKTKMWDEL